MNFEDGIDGEYESYEEGKGVKAYSQCKNKMKMRLINVIGEGIGMAKPEKLMRRIAAGGIRIRYGWLKMWALRVLSMVLLWAIALELKALRLGGTSTPNQNLHFPPARVYENNGYLMVSSNGGLNQMRSGICDMVTIARFLNVTLIVPELDNTSFWNDRSQFEDIFDVEYFIGSLRDQVQILKELPSRQKKMVSESLFSMPPISWSNMTYYYNVILPRIQTHKVVHFQKTDARLANNGLPLEVQKLRCRVNYKALRFAPPIQILAEKIVRILRERGSFLVLHLRYEMDMIAFSGCNEGCNDQEIEELTKMRYAYPWWKEKVIDSVKKRQAGLCPLTPEETTLALQALGIPSNIQVYIAAGDIYGGERRLASLRAAYPNLVKKETLLPESELDPFRNHSNRMAALDYFVAIESDIFVPTIGGNMAKLVEGHRRFLGNKKTILLDRKVLVDLIDLYKAGAISWEEFSSEVKEAHENRMGNPIERLVIPGKPKEEDYFYTNPQECLPAGDHQLDQDIIPSPSP